jgi:hypothetical protein
MKKNAYSLPEEYKTKWIEALESGEYHQDEGCLFNDNCGEYYCALGVALKAVSGIPNYELEGRSKIEDLKISDKWWVPNELVKMYKNEPLNVDWDKSSLSEHSSLADEIMYLNDTEQMSFMEIAVWIDTNVVSK